MVKALQSNDGNMCQANEWLMGAQTDDAATAHSAVNSPSVQSPSYSLQSPSSSPAEWSWEKFLDEESSTEHRLTALEHIRDHVHEVVGENVKDNGRVLLGAFATHIRDEDYIHRKYGIRKLAIATVPAGRYTHCPHRIPFEQHVGDTKCGNDVWTLTMTQSTSLRTRFRESLILCTTSSTTIGVFPFIAIS